MRIQLNTVIHNIYNYMCVTLRKGVKQAETELGQAQLKLGLDFTLIFCRVGFSHLDW